MCWHSEVKWLSSEVLITNKLTKRVSIFKEHTHSNLWIRHNHNSQEMSVLYILEYSFFYLLVKWQHSNYSVKVNIPQIRLLNLNGCLFPIATTSHLWHFSFLKLCVAKIFIKSIYIPKQPLNHSTRVVQSQDKLENFKKIWTSASKRILNMDFKNC